MKPKTHVVTGGTGHIGNVLLRTLVSQGKNVKAIIPTWESTNSIDDLIKQNLIEISRGDILDKEYLKETFSKNDIVYHLAGIVQIDKDKIDKLYEVNVKGTENVVEASLESKIKRLVYVSSSEARTPPSSEIMDESCGFNAENLEHHYQKSKAIATNKVEEAITNGLDAVIVTPTGVVGPHDYKPSIFGKMMIKFAKGKMPAYVEGGYDFVDVRDVVQCLILAAENKDARGKNYIASGQRIEMYELMLMLNKNTGKKIPKIKFPYKLARKLSELKLFQKKIPELTPQSLDILQSPYEISHRKATKELGYHPRKIKETIKETINWFRRKGLINNIYQS
jgi:dihydroflavonol-4-reductase